MTGMFAEETESEKGMGNTYSVVTWEMFIEFDDVVW